MTSHARAIVTALFLIMLSPSSGHSDTDDSHCLAQLRLPDQKETSLEPNCVDYENNVCMDRTVRVQVRNICTYEIKLLVIRGIARDQPSLPAGGQEIYTCLQKKSSCDSIEIDVQSGTKRPDFKSRASAAADRSKQNSASEVKSQARAIVDNRHEAEAEARRQALQQAAQEKQEAEEQAEFQRQKMLDFNRRIRMANQLRQQGTIVATPQPIGGASTCGRPADYQVCVEQRQFDTDEQCAMQFCN
ncbi:hypothetical protein [Rhizobium ruizarguesonis]|uniref:hypothetical protein n=1 Tax=Rhizobium ruizarguesonis TaxID=2081791 RepID=UPI00102FADCC|nr:hypothetical protein [Rhizobium ruizarguesonis]TAT70059.1 hypothetical protein ELI52_38195 [Rhizobium ruizarguesonis]